eukprot:TRINITY_DN9262_c1_g1_i2.p2 TRINITY_DN9262_c1_g1~~TRINITY_DN9262_c1_g1_i2.p2  ORF type:complete len:450 (-),score=76.91 TRINITY_DN9262_c1_g1_i2:42-1391(-)
MPILMSKSNSADVIPPRSRRATTSSVRKKLDEYKEVGHYATVRGKPTGGARSTPASLMGDDPPPSASANGAPAKKGEKTFLYMAKSWAVRTSASTQVGRAMILSLISEDGARIIETLTEIVEIQNGEKFSCEVKRKLLELVLKAKFLFDEGILSRKDSYKCELAVVAMSKALLEVLEDNRGASVEIIEDYCSEVRKHILNFIGETEAVSQKTLQSLTELMEYFGGSEFIEILIFGKEVAVQRETLRDALFGLLAPILGNRVTTRVTRFAPQPPAQFRKHHAAAAASSSPSSRATNAHHKRGQSGDSEVKMMEAIPAPMEPDPPESPKNMSPPNPSADSPKHAEYSAKTISTSGGGDTPPRGGIGAAGEVKESGASVSVSQMAAQSISQMAECFVDDGDRWRNSESYDAVRYRSEDQTHQRQGSDQTHVRQPSANTHISPTLQDTDAPRR